MSRQPYSKADKQRRKQLLELGCIVCLNELNIFTPPATHHIDGQTKEGCHQLTLPLCPRHHQIKSNDGKWISRHADGRAAFEKEYGTERELLKQVNDLISIKKGGGV